MLSQEEQSGRLSRRPQRGYPVATVADFCTAVLRDFLFSRRKVPARHNRMSANGCRKILPKRPRHDRISDDPQLGAFETVPAKDVILPAPHANAVVFGADIGQIQHSNRYCREFFG